MDSTTDEMVPVMITAWEPTPAEIEALKRGAKIHLSLYGSMHPPVRLSVGEVPE